jgi:peptide/nickel transport system substrate-binding protein
MAIALPSTRTESLVRRLITLLASVGTCASLATTVLAADRTTVVVGKTFIAAAPSPMSGSAAWAWQSHGVGQTLFTVDRNGRLVPQLAEYANRDGDAWVIRLHEGLRFSDGSPLDAAAVAESLMLANRDHPLGKASGGVLTAAVIDNLTLSLRTERPVPVMESMLAEWPFVIHRKRGDATVFTGPYRVKDFLPGAQATLEPNPHFSGAETRPDIVIRRFGDAQSLVLALESGEVDMAFHLPPESVPRLRRSNQVTVKSTLVGYQLMAWYNMRRAPFDDVRVRQAADLAIDRNTLVDVLGGGKAATGLYAAFFPFAPQEPRPTDPARAESLLAEAGWVRDGRGPRMKNGQSLSVTLTGYTQRPETITMLPVLKAMLERVGFRVETRIAENINTAVSSGDYQMLLWAQHTAPAGDGAFMLSGFFGSLQGYDRWGYRSEAMETVIADLGRTVEPAGRALLITEAHRILFADTPVSFLITPEWHVGLSRRMMHYEPFPTDYYIVRPDLTGPGPS